MGAWLDRLKIQKTPDTHATKPTKPTPEPVAGGFVGFVACPTGGLEISEQGFVGFVAYPQGHSEKFEGAGQQPDTQAANDAAPDLDPDRWCWPHSSAWNTGEIELFNRRAALFVRRGASDAEAEQLADRLVRRDREDDERHICHECRHLRGGLPGLSCGNGRAAEFPILTGMGLAREFTAMLQRCPGFAAAGLPATAPTFVAAPAPATQAKPMTVSHRRLCT